MNLTDSIAKIVAVKVINLFTIIMTKSLSKISPNGQKYRLVFLNNGQVIWKYSKTVGNEAGFSEKVAEFNNETKAIEYWNKI